MVPAWHGPRCERAMVRGASAVSRPISVRRWSCASRQESREGEGEDDGMTGANEDSTGGADPGLLVAEGGQDLLRHGPG